MKAVSKGWLDGLRWLNPAARVGLGLLILLAVVAGGFSWYVEPFRSAERQLYSFRASLFPEFADTDNRITLIVFTDETVIATQTQNPLDRSLLARALAAIDALGPQSVTVDMLFDLERPEDGALLQVMRGMHAPLYLFGEDKFPRDEWEGRRTVHANFVEASGVPASHLVSLALQEDDDYVIRTWPTARPDQYPLLARALSGGMLADYDGPIRFRAPSTPNRPVITTLPIDIFADPDLGEVAALLGPEIAGRHVLIGADLTDVDQYSTPLIDITGDTRLGQMAGIEVHANMLAQALDGQRYWKPPTWFPPLLPLLILPLAMLTAALAMPRWLRTILIIGQLAWLVIVPFAVEYLYEDSAGVGAFGWLMCWAIGPFAVAMVRRAKAWEQGRIAQSALTRYLPPEIAEQIINDPTRLALNGQRCQVFALFSDLEGFTALCQSEAPDEIATFLNDYLETLSQVVLDHGGTIDKFVGDAVVAFWGAPLAREDDGERAARAAVAIHEAGEMFRSRVLPAGGRVGRTRVGLHYGEAIVGNFGGDGRIQYTALGDTMNLAARLENANKQLGTSILLSREAAAFASGIVLRTMGRIVVRGRTTPVAVMEPGLGIEAVDVERMNNLYEGALAGDAQAREELAAWASDRKFDLGLARLVERLDDAGTNGATRLR